MALKRDWLDDGSLLVLMPLSLLPEWRGTDGPDYDRACEAAAGDWLVPFDVGGKRALLLGGEPGMALFVPLPNTGLALVRWSFAADEEELVAFALRREGVRRTEPDQAFDNAEPTWVLFNAACNPLGDAPPMREANMPTGRVIADTALVEAGRNAAILHRFVRPIPG